MVRSWLGLALVGLGALSRVACAQTLGDDGFPADWTPADLTVGTSSTLQMAPLEGTTPGVIPYAVPVPAQPKMVQPKGGKTPAHKMVQMRVDQMKSVALAPSGSAVIALPPVTASEGDASPAGPVAEDVSLTFPGTLSGVLPEAVAGGRNVWTTAPQREWEESLPRALSRGVASPALKEAWRRLLLAETQAPDPAGAKGNWLAFRAGQLETLGMYEAAWSLWRQVPQALAQKAPDLALGWVQSRLLSGAPVEACKLARAMAATQGPSSPWPVQVAVCQLLQPAAEGNVAAAGLSLQLIEPSLRASNPALLRVLQAVQEGKPVGVNSGGPLGGAVLAAYPALIGSGTLAKLPDMALRRLAGSSALPGALRAASSLALANQTGLISDGVMAWQLVSSTSLAVVPDAVVLAGKTKYPAALVVPAALRLGDVSTAMLMAPQWQVSGTEKASRSALLYPQAEVLLAARKGPVAPEVWEHWLAALPLENALTLQAGLRLLLGLESLEINVPAPVWAKVHARNPTGAAGADPVSMRVLAEAVEARNIPKVYALSAEMLAGRPASELPAGTVAAVIRALHALGQQDLAWRLLAEAVLPPPSLKNVFPPVVPVAAPVVKTVPVAPAAKAAAGAVSPSLLAPPTVLKPVKPTVRVPAVSKPHLVGKKP